jgi:kynurenine formamidase
MSDISRRAFVMAGTLAAAALAEAGSALAQAPGAGPAQAVDDFIRAVKRARVFDLSHVWDERSPLLSLNPPFALALNRTHAQTYEIFGNVPGSQISFASDMMYFSGQHGAPSIDAIGHIGRNLKLHGGVDAVAASRPDGLGQNLGIETYPQDLLVNRGVLLDVARTVNGGRPDPLPPGFEVTRAHLEDTARRQRVTIEKGDTVLIRTGFGQHFGTKNEVYLGDGSPGPGVDAARFLASLGVRATGADTATYEKRPAVFGKELFPVHMTLLADNGIHIIENFALEEIGTAGVHLFVLVVNPLKIRGATGSPLRAFALVPPGGG